MRKFTFTPDAAGRTDFFVIYQSVRQIDPEKATKDERPYIAATLRVLDRISDPIGDEPADADEFTVDMRFRKLKPGTEPTTIEISAKIHEKVAAWIDGAKFQAGTLVAVEDCTVRWGQAEKFERSDSEDPAAAGTVRKSSKR